MAQNAFAKLLGSCGAAAVSACIACSELHPHRARAHIHTHPWREVGAAAGGGMRMCAHLEDEVRVSLQPVRGQAAAAGAGQAKHKVQRLGEAILYVCSEVGRHWQVGTRALWLPAR